MTGAHVDLSEFSDSPGTGDYPFGVSPAASARALRRLADQVESGDVVLQAVGQAHKASATDFQSSVLTVEYVRKIPRGGANGG